MTRCIQSKFRTSSVLKTLVCLFAVTNICYPQTKRWKLDSIQALLQDTANLTSDHLGQLFVQAGLQEEDKQAILFYDRALSILNDSNLIVEASYQKGVSLYLIGEYTKVVSTILPVLKYAERTSLHWYINGFYGLLGMSYGMTGRYDLAIRYQQKSIAKAEKFPARLGREYANLGLLYYKIRDNRKAIQSYKKALKHMQSGEGYVVFGKEIPLVLTNIGLCYNEMDSLPLAREYFDEASRICGSMCDEKKNMHLAFGRGMLEIRLSQFERAKRHLKSALVTSRKFNDSRMEAESLVYLARVYLATSETDSAAIAIAKSESIAQRADLNEILLDTYRQSVDLFTKTHEYNKLAKSQQKFIRQKEKLYGAELARDLALIGVDVAEQAHHQQLTLQQDRVDIQTKIMTYQRLSAQLWGFVLVLLTLLGCGLYFRTIQRKKVQEILDRRISERRTELTQRESRASSASRKLSSLEKKLEHELELVVLPDHIRIF